MFNNSSIIIGQYRPHDSFLYRVDSRAKLIIIITVMLLSLITDSILFYLLSFALIIVTMILSGITASTLMKNYKPVILLVIITFLYHILFGSDSGDTLIVLFGNEITLGALGNASYYSLRLLLFIGVAFIVTLTSSPSDLAEGITKILLPLERFKLPIRQLGLVMFIAIRFIPLLQVEFEMIRRAQMIRGTNFSGSVLSRMRNSVSIILPVLVTALGRADELAMAMEARGYNPAALRTFYSRIYFNAGSILFLIVSHVVFLSLFYLTG